MNRSRHQKIITASEIGEYVFCAKAWQLKRDGIHAKSPKLKSGTVYHQQHQGDVTRAQMLTAAGKILTLLAALALLIWMTIRLWQ